MHTAIIAPTPAKRTTPGIVEARGQFIDCGMPNNTPGSLYAALSLAALIALAPVCPARASASEPPAVKAKPSKAALDSLDGKSKAKVRLRSRQLYRLPSGLIVDATNYVKAMDEYQKNVESDKQVHTDKQGTVHRSSSLKHTPFSERVPSTLFEVYGGLDTPPPGGDAALAQPRDFTKRWNEIELANRLVRVERSSTGGEQVIGWAPWYAKYFLSDARGSYYFDAKLSVAPTAVNGEYAVSLEAAPPGVDKKFETLTGVTIDPSLFVRGSTTQLQPNKEYLLVPTYASQDPIAADGPGTNATVTEKDGKRVVTANPPAQTGWRLLDAGAARLSPEEAATLILEGRLPLVEWTWDKKTKAWQVTPMELQVQKKPQK